MVINGYHDKTFKVESEYWNFEDDNFEEAHQTNFELNATNWRTPTPDWIRQDFGLRNMYIAQRCRFLGSALLNKKIWPLKYFFELSF